MGGKDGIAEACLERTWLVLLLWGARNKQHVITTSRLQVGPRWPKFCFENIEQFRLTSAATWKRYLENNRIIPLFSLPNILVCINNTWLYEFTNVVCLLMRFFHTQQFNLNIFYIECLNMICAESITSHHSTDLILNTISGVWHDGKLCKLLVIIIWLLSVMVIVIMIMISKYK